MGIDPVTHRPRTDLNILTNLPQLIAAANFATNFLNHPTMWPDTTTATHPTLTAALQPPDATKIQLLHNLLQVLGSGSAAPSTSSCTTAPNMEAILSLLGSSSVSPDHQPYSIDEYLRLVEHSRLQGYNINGLTGGFASQINPTQIQTTSSTTSSFTNIGVPRDHNHHHHHPQPMSMDNQYQPISSSKLISTNHNNTNIMSVETSNKKNSNANIPTDCNQLPLLVSASPDDHDMNGSSVANKNQSSKSNQNHDHIISSNPSSTTSTTFDQAWGDLIDDETTDSYWKDIME